jgi:hypothetical protein
LFSKLLVLFAIIGQAAVDFLRRFLLYRIITKKVFQLKLSAASSGESSPDRNFIIFILRANPAVPPGRDGECARLQGQPAKKLHL